MQAERDTKQTSLSACVMVAKDTPMLHIMEARQDRQHREKSELRHYRLDTIEDTEAMPGSLQLPHSPGAGPRLLCAWA